VWWWYTTAHSFTERFCCCEYCIMSSTNVILPVGSSQPRIYRRSTRCVEHVDVGMSLRSKTSPARLSYEDALAHCLELDAFCTPSMHGGPSENILIGWVRSAKTPSNAKTYSGPNDQRFPKLPSCFFRGLNLKFAESWIGSNKAHAALATLCL
jgi:hypothetical protein